jgi:hypothetical protein
VVYLQCDQAGAGKAWINTGSGWQRNDNWKPPVVISHWKGSKNIDKGVRFVDITAGGFQLSLSCQPEPVFVQALQAPAVSHCK